MTTKAKAPRKAISSKVNANDLGCALHTALRKACDSSPTSAMWNLINTDQLTTTWDKYLNELLEELRKIESPTLGNFIDITLSAWDTFGSNVMPSTRSPNYCIAVAAHCCFEMFTINDWYGFVNYLPDIGIRLRKSTKTDIQGAAERLAKCAADTNWYVSTGIGEHTTTEPCLYVHVSRQTSATKNLAENGYGGYKVKIINSGKFKPC